MQLFFKILLSPMAFALGFFWPLLSQTFIALDALQNSHAIIAAGIIAIVFGLLAQLRGSWIWIK